jgi:hypothetical protein
MPHIAVSTTILREKAQKIRTLAAQGLDQHRLCWAQMNLSKGQMPVDLRTSHEYANDPWNQAIEAHYNNYAELATSMEKAAAWYDQYDTDVANSFTPQE